MHSFILIEPFEDGVRHVKRYLCQECYERLQQLKFVRECENENKKTKKEDPGKEKEEDGESY